VPFFGTKQTARHSRAHKANGTFVPCRLPCRFDRAACRFSVPWESMRLTIEHNFPEVQRELDTLRADMAGTVTARALNRTIEQARTQMSRQIRAEFAVDTAFVRDRLRIKKAAVRGGALMLEATLDAQEKPRSANLIRFKARESGAGVAVQIKRGNGRKVVKGAFIGNKGRTVFERVPGTKMASRKWGKTHGQQIKPVQTINVPQMFNTRRINAAVVAAMQARFPAIFERELAYAMSRFSR
jgi:hypothetical protein